MGRRELIDLLGAVAAPLGVTIPESIVARRRRGDRMRRRELIGVLGAAIVSPFAALAQKQLPVIAVLGSGSVDASLSRTQMVLTEAGLNEIGLVQGRDYVFDIRWADSDASRFPALAAELLSHHPSVIVVSTHLAVKVVQNLSRTIPIVSAGLNDPVAAGLATSLSHPGGNLTGVSTVAQDTLPKLFEIMREMLPGVRKLGAMTNPTNPSNQPMIETLTRYAESTGMTIATVRVSSPADLDTCFAELSRQKPGALFVVTDNSLIALADTIVARAFALGIPTFGYPEFFARAGGLFAYSRDQKETYYTIARLVKKVLNGDNPGDLPIEQPTRFNFIINLKTAKAFNINVPPMLIVRADEVIE